MLTSVASELFMLCMSFPGHTKSDFGKVTKVTEIVEKVTKVTGKVTKVTKVIGKVRKVTKNMEKLEKL